MFIVFNRAKINSYLISIGTVMILFSMPFMINKNMDIVETSALEEELNSIQDENKILVINNSESSENIISANVSIE